jgi:hypothetical protein
MGMERGVLFSGTDNKNYNFLNSVIVMTARIYRHPVSFLSRGYRETRAQTSVIFLSNSKEFSLHNKDFVTLNL